MLVDPTKTNAWSKLADLAKDFRVDLRESFKNDPDRVQRYSYSMADLYIDLSKNLVTQEVLDALLELAGETGLAAERDAMFNGEKINLTEGRSVLHTALRRPITDQLEVSGQDVVSDVHKVLEQIYAFADQIRSGDWKGVTGKQIQTVVNIGIGGSDLGPVMVYEALKPYKQENLDCRFVSNIDPTDLVQKVSDLDPETTLFIVASKTFTTLETMTNARAARRWLLEQLVASGAFAGVSQVADLSDDDCRAATSAHFAAVSTNLQAVAEFGIDPKNAFGFWDWVGGRYSVDSAVGTSLVVAFGKEVFEEFLDGFHQVDEHFYGVSDTENVPLLMGLLNIWYRNFLGVASHAVLPYAQLLHRFPAYLQQLTMESNGKTVRKDGSVVTYQTGEIFWGEPGTNGQHAFYQLIHQGSQLIPADFIAFANPAYPLEENGVDQHELFLANFLAQTKALAFGKTAQEVKAEGTSVELIPHRIFAGNRPTTSIMAADLTPSVMGQLIALYEHITFVQGVIWGINPFDQWGVELGKKLAIEVGPALNGDEAALAKQDSSTAGLINFYRSNRR